MRLLKTWGRTTARGHANWWKSWLLWKTGKLLLSKTVPTRKMPYSRTTDDRILLWAVQSQDQRRSISTELSPGTHTGRPPHHSQRSWECRTIIQPWCNLSWLTGLKTLTIKLSVQSLKKWKSARVDNVPEELVQAGGEDVITTLTTICNKIRQTGEWPTPWTPSLVITLPKKGNLQQCHNNQTISLISSYWTDWSYKRRRSSLKNR